MSLELNKIAAAVLTGGVVVMGTSFVADLLVKPQPPEEPVYKVALKEDTGGGGSGDGGSGSGASDDGGEEQAPDLATLLADASASAGEKGVQVCKACHSFNQGGPHKVGPNLYNVVGTDIASADGFNYSQALKDKDGAWTYEKLAGYLENPNGWAPGNNMSYQGIKDSEKLADVIAYLRAQSDDPMPLPEPEAQEANDGGAGESGDAEEAADASDAGEAGSGGDMAGDQAEAADDAAADDASADEAGETQTAKADAAGGDGAGGGSGLEQKIASADPSAGESASGVCAACHSFNKGGPNKVGPNLYDVVGDKVADHDGFNYSDALAGVGGDWTLEKVDSYLKNPNEFAPGNRMTYPGVKDDQKRYDIIAYMLEQSEEGGGN